MTFENVYKENADMVLNLAYRMTGREEVARDLSQDIFIKVYRNQEYFREESKISTWIYRIALNHIINYMKRESRMSIFDFSDEKNTVLANEDLTYQQTNTPVRPDQKLENEQKEMIVRKLINDLPVKYRIPLLLFRYEDLTYQEIAQNLSISLSAVETRIHRAKKKLAEKLKPWLEIL